MAISRRYRFYRRYFSQSPSRWLRWLGVQQRMALLQQVTQWRTVEMSEEEYRHWL